MRIARRNMQGTPPHPRKTQSQRKGKPSKEGKDVPGGGIPHPSRSSSSPRVSTLRFIRKRITLLQMRSMYSQNVSRNALSVTRTKQYNISLKMLSRKKEIQKSTFSLTPHFKHALISILATTTDRPTTTPLSVRAARSVKWGESPNPLPKTQALHCGRRGRNARSKKK